MFEWRRARKLARRSQIEYLESVYRQSSLERNFGVCREKFDRKTTTAPASIACAHLLRASEGKSTVLFPALFKVWLAWQWGLQATGDCVSWGTAHMFDVNMATAFLAGKIRQPDGLVSSEAIYGFGKSELFNSYGRHGQGMNGIDAVDACKKFGTLYRKRYPEYDLRSYNGSYALEWGESSRRSHGVPDMLEPYAAEHKAPEYARVDSIKSAAALIEAGYAWQYCGKTYWPTSRDSDGMGKRFESGWHCMTCVGVIYDEDGKPAWWRIANTSHGDHVEGPNEPGAVPSVYQECGGWVPNRLVEPVIRAGDCYCTTFVEGWPVLDLPDLGWERWL